MSKSGIYLTVYFVQVSASDDWLAATKTNLPRKSIPTTVDEEESGKKYFEIPKTNIKFDRRAQKRSKEKNKEDNNERCTVQSKHSDFSMF